MLSLTPTETLGADLPEAGVMVMAPPEAVAVYDPFPAKFIEAASAAAIVSEVLVFPHLEETVTPPTAASVAPASYSVIVLALTPPLNNPARGVIVKSLLPVAV